MIFKNWTKAKKLKSYLFLVSILVPKHPGAELLQEVLCIEGVFKETKSFVSGNVNNKKTKNIIRMKGNSLHRNYENPKGLHIKEKKSFVRTVDRAHEESNCSYMFKFNSVHSCITTTF